MPIESFSFDKQLITNYNHYLILWQGSKIKLNTYYLLIIRISKAKLPTIFITGVDVD